MKLLLIVLFVLQTDSLQVNDSTQVNQNVLVFNGTKIKSDSVAEKGTTYFGLTSEQIKILTPIAIPLIVLLITNIVVLIKIRLDSKEAVRKELILVSIKTIRDRLEFLYDPIFIYLTTNSEIFQSFGYKSYPEQYEQKEEASELWGKMAKSIIIPNNERIVDSIKRYSHLILPNDNLDNYIEFVKHAESYKHFMEFPNEQHKMFKYPTDFLSHVRQMRQNLKNDLEKINKNVVDRIDNLK